MDLTSLRLSGYPCRLLMLRRKLCGARRILARGLILRRRRNLQRDRSQGDIPMLPSSVFRCSGDDPKETLQRSGTAVAISCAGTRRRSTPIRPRTSHFAFRRTSEANSCARRPYPPRDMASQHHRRRRTSRVIAVLCESLENYSRDIDRRPEWGRAPRILTTVQRVAAPSAAESLALSVTTAGGRRFAPVSASTGSEYVGRPTIDGSVGCGPIRCSTMTWWHCHASHWEAPREVHSGERQDAMSKNVLHVLL